jgi:hypothetical protein
MEVNLFLKKLIDGLTKTASRSISPAPVNQQIIHMLTSEGSSEARVLTENFVMNVYLSIGSYPWMTQG